jgi:hypothetical protein
MSIVIGMWKTLRGMGLLVVLAVIITLVLTVSCVTMLLSGSVLPDRVGRFHIET